jgi:hypothetical protein
MKEFKVGYKKPPLHTRFKKGVCPNPKGRGGAKPLRAGKIFEGVVQATVPISANGKKKRITRTEYMIRRWGKEAAKGDIRAAELLLDVHHYSKKMVTIDTNLLQVRNGKYPAT